MLFGFTNIPATFQDYINKFLAEKLNIFIIIYLNIIPIYSKNKGKKYVKAI